MEWNDVGPNLEWIARVRRGVARQGRCKAVGFRGRQAHVPMSESGQGS